METVPKDYHARSADAEKTHRANDTMFTAAGATAGALLESLPTDCRRVYTTGAAPGGAGIVALRTWAAEHGAEWETAGDQYLALAQPRLTYTHRLTGRKVYVFRAAPWFGADASPATCASAWRSLGDALTQQWNFRGQRAGEWRPVHLYGTPATTGRLLLERQWAETGRTFEPLPAELQESIRATSSQGRFELGPPAEVGAPRGLWVYDAAFMYAACSNELPTGRWEHDYGHEVPAHVRGRYRVQFRAPKAWRHIGMLGVPTEHGMSYPADAASWHETWADSCEVALARQYGWTVRPVERLLWPDRSLRPLDTWARRLVKVRESITVADEGDELSEVGRAMRGAVRAILVQTIGALVGAPRKRTAGAEVGDEWRIPDAANLIEPATLQGGRWVWTEKAPPAFESMQHPEWAAHVWAKARARLLSDTHGAGALAVPPAELFALALDSIAVTAPVPEWADNHRVGEFRLKQRRTAPAPACRTMREYHALEADA